jgi:AraC-like DNA-binding protein
MSESADFLCLDAPLHTPLTRLQTRAASLQAFSTFVTRLGGDPRSILDRNGIALDVLEDPEHPISCASIVNSLEYCSEHFRIPMFGLMLGSQQSESMFGCVSAACRSAPDFGTALRDFAEFMPIINSPSCRFDIWEGENVVELRMNSDLRDHTGDSPQANSMALIRITNLFRSISGGAVTPKYVSTVARSSLRQHDEIEALFGCRAYASDGAEIIGFAPEAMAQPLPAANRLVHNLLGLYIRNARQAAESSLVERVEDYIVETIATGQCSIEDCCRKIGISLRKMQIDLKREGASFIELMEAQRERLAKLYLKQGDISLDQVAFLLGYAEQTSFGRAFKRWTEDTPRRFREKCRLELH